MGKGSSIAAGLSWVMDGNSGSEWWKRKEGSAIDAFSTLAHPAPVGHGGSTSYTSSLSLLLRCFMCYQGLIPCAAACSIPWLQSGALPPDTSPQPGFPGSPIPAFLPQDRDLFSNRTPLPVRCMTSLCAPWDPAHQSPPWAVSQCLGSYGTPNPVGCSPGMGEGVRSWRKRV